MDTKLLWLSYIIYFFLGCIFISEGVLVLSIAQTYHLSLSYLGYLLFLSSVAQAITTYYNGFWLEKSHIKLQAIGALLVLAISCLFIISGVFSLLVIGLILLGGSLGILLSIPSYIVIARFFKEKFAKFNALSFVFSFGGMVCPAFIGQMLHLQMNWQTIVIIGLIMIAFITATVLFIPFDYIENHNQSTENKRKTRWNWAIYGVAAAMFFYQISECIFSLWIVSFLNLVKCYTISQAGLGLSLFWFFVTFGRFFSVKIGKFLPLHYFIILSSLVSFVAYGSVLFTSGVVLDYFIIAMIGTGYAGVYAAILSFGINQLPFSCPQLMSFFVTVGTVGGFLAFPISSFFINQYGIFSALFVGLIMVGMKILVIFGVSLYCSQSNACVINLQ